MKSFTKFGLFMSFAIASLTITPVLAQLPFTSDSHPSQETRKYPPAPDTGTPDGQRTPGGSRPELITCKNTNQPLTALVPKNAKGLTAVEHPSFWFYIPYSPEDVESIEFSLHNRDEKSTLYRTSLQLTKIPGIIEISLPPSSDYSLQLNQTYHWYFTVECKSNKQLLILDGWITRVNLSSELWYDQLTNLAKQYFLNRQNTEVKQAFLNLLKSVGLETLVE